MFFILFATHTQTPLAASSSSFSAPSSSLSPSSSFLSLSLSLLLSLSSCCCSCLVWPHNWFVCCRFHFSILAAVSGSGSCRLLPCAFCLLTQCSIVFCACPHTYILISQVWHRERGKALPSFLLLSLFSLFSSFPLALSIIQQFSHCSLIFHLWVF